MTKRRLGRSELFIEPLVLGTNVIGWTADEPTSFAVLDAFVAKGVPLGTALAFLLSAVGVSFPELVMLRSVMTVRLLVAFCLVVLVGTTIIDWVFNALA